MKHWLIGFWLVGCGGAAAAPPPPAPAPTTVEEDRVSGCWQDPGDGTVLCLEDAGYILLLPEGKWDRAIVDWAEKTPSRRSGRTRTPRPLLLSVAIEGDALVMDDGVQKTRLVRPGPAERAAIDARISRLPKVEEACTAAEQCRRRASVLLGKELGTEELDSPRGCIGFLNAVSAILSDAGHQVPQECVGG